MKSSSLIGCAISTLALCAAGTASGAAAQTSPSIRPIAIDQTITGRIGKKEQECAVSSPSEQYYRFSTGANSRLQIIMRAQTEEFDTVVDLGKMNGCQFEQLASNDDGGMEGNSTDSRLTVRLADAGTYIVRARGVSDESAGNYSLVIKNLPPAQAAPAPTPITVGPTIQGELTSSDPTIMESSDSIMESNRAYDLYVVNGTAGKTVKISVDSDDFDTMLEVGGMTAFGFASAVSNDDGSGASGNDESVGTNSRLSLTFPSNGPAVIRISAINGQLGKYTLQIK